MHQSIPPALSHPQPPPPGYCGTFACLVSPKGSSRGWGICKFCTARGWAFANPGAIPQAFDTHAVSYQNITAQKFLLEKKQIGLSVKDGNKLKRVFDFMLVFLHCLSSQNYIAKLELSMWINVFLAICLVIEEHPFIFIKLFITYKFTVLY